MKLHYDSRDGPLQEVKLNQDRVNRVGLAADQAVAPGANSFASNTC